MSDSDPCVEKLREEHDDILSKLVILDRMLDLLSCRMGEVYNEYRKMNAKLDRQGGALSRLEKRGAE